MNGLSPSLRAVRAAVGIRLVQVIDTHRGRWADLSPASDELFDTADALVSSGKRMRAVLGAVGLALGTPGAQPHKRNRLMTGTTASHLGAALEFYQASALVHDDASMRPSPVADCPRRIAKYTAQHASSGWRGDATTYGNSAAVLLATCSCRSPVPRWAPPSDRSPRAPKPRPSAMPSTP